MQPHEHYLEAERLLALADKHSDIGNQAALAAQAQAHATLALVPTPPPILDYQGLLQKYKKHVNSNEGADYLSNHHRSNSATWSNVKFTDAEWQALQKE